MPRDGAEADPITRWLRRRMGIVCRVVTADPDTSFLNVLDADNVEIRQLRLRPDGLPLSRFILVASLAKAQSDI